MTGTMPAADDGGPALGPAQSAALRLFVLLLKHTGGVTGLVEELLGRPVHPHLVEQDAIRQIRAPGLARLETTGPVFYRHLTLDDSLPPHLPVAVHWALVVPDRLPAEVRNALSEAIEPLDRLLNRHGLPWSVEALEGAASSVEAASTEFGWAEPGTPLVEQVCLIRLDAMPLAVTIDEVPVAASDG